MSEHSYDSLREKLDDLRASGRVADFGVVCAGHEHAILDALTVAHNVQEQGLAADLECGHVVSEDEVRQLGEDGPECCAKCYAAYGDEIG
jgi:hypothetical protein